MEKTEYYYMIGRTHVSESNKNKTAIRPNKSIKKNWNETSRAIIKLFFFTGLPALAGQANWMTTGLGRPGRDSPEEMRDFYCNWDSIAEYNGDVINLKISDPEMVSFSTLKSALVNSDHCNGLPANGRARITKYHGNPTCGIWTRHCRRRRSAVHQWPRYYSVKCNW